MSTAAVPAPGAIVAPATIGMLGGGQLGRYALMAATAMGFRTAVLDPDPTAPAGIVAGQHLVAAYDDPAALARLAVLADVVTTEFENPPADALDRLSSEVAVLPSPDAVRVAQDRIAEKGFLNDRGFPVGPHLAVRAGDPLDEAALVPLVSGGAIVKAARLGYDGKGQRRTQSVEGVADAIVELGDVDVVVETQLALLSEVSLLVARTADGRRVTWPVTENEHVDGILDVSVAPATVGAALAARATDLGIRIAEALDYVGVLAVELFVVEGDDGPQLLVNELAPRPHNSGHWTIDAAATSQFEQQIRAVCGLGLGATDLTAPAVAMVNLLGDLWFDADGHRREPRWDRALAHPAARLHLYGKADPRPGRKMGHLTVTAPSTDAARAAAIELRDELTR